MFLITFVVKISIQIWTALPTLWGSRWHAPIVATATQLQRFHIFTFMILTRRIVVIKNCCFFIVGVMNGQGTSDSPDLLPDIAEYVID